MALPAPDRPEDAAPLAAKIEELVAGKTAKQLWLEFKNSEEDEEAETVVTKKGGDVAPRDPETGKRLSAPRRTHQQMEADDDVDVDDDDVHSEDNDGD